MNHPSSLAIVADDLTGAADTGVQFAKRGFCTVLFPVGLKRTRLREVDVISLNTATRGMQAEPAYDEVISAIKTSRVIGVQSVRGSKHEQTQDLPRLIVEWLGKLALQIIENCSEPISGLILTGGDTALAVFEQLGISEVRLIDEILPGIPYGQVINGEFAGLDIVTKAGAFGDETALVKCIDFLA